MTFWSPKTEVKVGKRSLGRIWLRPCLLEGFVNTNSPCGFLKLERQGWFPLTQHVRLPSGTQWVFFCVFGNWVQNNICLKQGKFLMLLPPTSTNFRGFRVSARRLFLPTKPPWCEVTILMRLVIKISSFFGDQKKHNQFSSLDTVTWNGEWWICQWTWPWSELDNISLISPVCSNSEKNVVIFHVLVVKAQC